MELGPFRDRHGTVGAPAVTVPESFTRSGFPRRRAGRADCFPACASPIRSGCLRDSGVVAPSAPATLAASSTLPNGVIGRVSVSTSATGDGDWPVTLMTLMMSVGSSSSGDHGGVRGTPAALGLVAHPATVEVVVDEPHRLHERVDGGRADERPTAPLEVLRDRGRPAVSAGISGGRLAERARAARRRPPTSRTRRSSRWHGWRC